MSLLHTMSFIQCRFTRSKSERFSQSTSKSHSDLKFVVWKMPFVVVKRKGWNGIRLTTGSKTCERIWEK